MTRLCMHCGKKPATQHVAREMGTLDCCGGCTADMILRSPGWVTAYPIEGAHSPGESCADFDEGPELESIVTLTLRVRHWRLTTPQNIASAVTTALLSCPYLPDAEHVSIHDITPTKERDHG